MYNKLLDPIADIRVSAEMLLNGALGALSGDQREGVKRLYANAGGLYTLIVDVVTNIGLENLSQRHYLADRFDKVLQPLIHGSQGLLDEVDGPLHEEQQVSVLFINETAATLNIFIQRLRLYSQLLNHSLSLEPKPVAISSLLQAIIQQQELLPAVEITCDCPDAPPIRGQAELMQIALHEIVANAVRFTRKGEIKISMEKHDDTLQLHIQDTGVGIAPVYHQRIFEPFFQIDDQIESLGLGLFFAREILTLHHGSVTLNSRIHHGAHFTTRIPLSNS